MAVGGLPRPAPAAGGRAGSVGLACTNVDSPLDSPAPHPHPRRAAAGGGGRHAAAQPPVCGADRGWALRPGLQGLHACHGHGGVRQHGAGWPTWPGVGEGRGAHVAACTHRPALWQCPPPPTPTPRSARAPLSSLPHLPSVPILPPPPTHTNCSPTLTMCTTPSPWASLTM